MLAAQLLSGFYKGVFFCPFGRSGGCNGRICKRVSLFSCIVQVFGLHTDKSGGSSHVDKCRYKRPHPLLPGEAPPQYKGKASD